MSPDTNQGTAGGAHRCCPQPWYRTVFTKATTRSTDPISALTIRIGRNVEAADMTRL
jgi:hypothetical protein